MKLLLMLAAAVAAIPVITNTKDEIAGTYECRGMRPDGAVYRGVVQITPHNGAYQLVWSFGDDQPHLGIGIVNGNVLAVSYFGGTPGVVAYRIEHGEKGAQLVGQWTVPEADGHVFEETLTRLSGEVTHPRPPAPRPSRLRPLRNGRSA